MRCPLAVTDPQPATAAPPLLPPRETRDIQGRIGPLARDHLGGQGPPHRIAHRVPHFALGYLRAIILAMATRHEPLWTHARRGTPRRAAARQALGAPVVHTHGGLRHTALTLPPTVIVTLRAQDTFQPLVGAIEPLDGWPGHRLQGAPPVGSPGFDRHEAVSAPGDKG